MANIVIIGDTWGIVPAQLWCSDNLIGDIHPPKDPNVIDWLDYILISKGHNVYNRSWGGTNNWLAFTQLEPYIESAKKHKFNVDLVIWFHTDIIKNWDRNPNWSGGKKHFDKLAELGYSKFLDYLAEVTYNKATALKMLSPNTKWAIIGGFSALRESKKQMLDWADLRIDNLRSVLTNNAVPECQSLTIRDEFEQFSDLIDENDAKKELENRRVLYQMCAAHPSLFHTNGMHITPKSSKILTEMLVEKFKL